MSFPQVVTVNGGNNNVNSTSHTVNLPASIASGDLLLVFFASDAAPTITFPDGWTALFQASQAANVKLGCWYRIADGTEGDTITVTTSTSEMTAHTSYRITGYSGTPEVGTAATGTTTTPNPPSLTPSWGAQDTLWFASCGWNRGDFYIISYPSNYTNGREDRANDIAGSGVGTARRELNVASEDPGTFSLAVGGWGWVANTVAIQPLPAVIGSAAGSGIGLSQSSAYLIIPALASGQGIGEGLAEVFRVILAQAQASGIGTLTLDASLIPYEYWQLIQEVPVLKTKIAELEAALEPKAHFRI